MGRSMDEFQPGQRVVITQQIPQRDEVWTTRTEGEVVRYEQKKTGSWYAHAKNHKLWLDRLVLRKDDGEIVVFNLDSYTHVETADPNNQTGDDQASGGQTGDDAASEPSVPGA